MAPETTLDPWDPAARRAALGVAADDPWCIHMAALRASLDGDGPAPTDAAREAALVDVRAEATTMRNGDPLWPFRKALICEYVQGAAEEREEFDWATAAEFLEAASMAASNPPSENGVSPLVPVFDHLDGGEPESLAPVDLSNPAYCDALETSELALSQQRGGVVDAVSFPGSLRRAPDWFATVQVSYHRWAREQLEGHQIAPGAVDYGGIPYHCHRFHAAQEGSKTFALKDNLIFLLPELDDPEKSGRLVVQDAEGGEIVLDRVLAAAQLDSDGSEGEEVDFFPEDLAAAPRLSGAVERSSSLPPPRVFQIHFDFNRLTPREDDPQIAALLTELAKRDPGEPLRIQLSGHADCVGSSRDNKEVSSARARAVFSDIIRPALIERGFDEAALNDRRRFKLVGLGASAPAVKPGAVCRREEANRRVVVVVQ